MITNPREYAYSYETDDISFTGVVRPQDANRIGLSNQFFSRRVNDSTIIHEVGHTASIGFKHLGNNNVQYGGQFAMSFNIRRAQTSRQAHPLNRNTTPRDLELQKENRSLLLYDNYNLVQTANGVNYRVHERNPKYQ